MVMINKYILNPQQCSEGYSTWFVSVCYHTRQNSFNLLSIDNHYSTSRCAFGATISLCSLDIIISSHVGVYLSLKGVVYANNSVISITEIEQTNTSANNGLQCITDRMPCCRDAHKAGEWFFPSGSVVPIGGVATTFYRNRGDDGTVNLNRVNNDVMMPTGRFCCVVPDATGADQTLCVNIG